LNEGTLLVDKEDTIGWYIYLVNTLIDEQHKYEFFQGSRIVPIFKRIGIDLDLVKSIGGIEKRVRDLLYKRKHEADALLFEILTALLWVKNGYKVDFIEEEKEKKTPDIIATKDKYTYKIECKRQSKTSDYSYRETEKRQKMISRVSEYLLKFNARLHIDFRVEILNLPDSYLEDLLKGRLETASEGQGVTDF
jgi:hypothetical protein